jgi:lysophospholipase L1-like esterase
MAPRPVRIVALGDSTTAGTPGFLSPLEAPPDGRGDITSQYAYWLMQAHPGWDVLNRGINGERSDQIRARFARDVLAVSPRAAIVIAGVNDIYQGLSPAHVIGELEAMYTAAAEAGIPVIAGSIVPYNTATVDQNARMAEVNDWIRAHATESADIIFVDTRAAVADPGNPDLLADTPDQLHPSPIGYRRMAEALGAALERILLE